MHDCFGDNDRERELLEQGIERANRALEISPNDARAMVLGAGARLKLGNKKTGVEWLQQAQDVAQSLRVIPTGTR